MLHPLSAFLAPWFAGGPPTLDALNDAAARRGIVTGNGVPLCFEPATAIPGAAYEERTFTLGRVATRADNPHDLFNALIWLCFPRTKAMLNRRHVGAIRAAAGPSRGPLRDALTQFDECGVIVAGSDPSLWDGMRAHRWREVFADRREALAASTAFVVVGHASHDALRAPYPGLCGKAVFVPLDADRMAAVRRHDFDELDARLAQRFAAADLAPKSWQPLPLLGIPGATPDNEQPAYYDDTRQFRPARTMQVGSPLDSR